MMYSKMIFSLLVLVLVEEVEMASAAQEEVMSAKRAITDN